MRCDTGRISEGRSSSIVGVCHRRPAVTQSPHAAAELVDPSSDTEEETTSKRAARRRVGGEDLTGGWEGGREGGDRLPGELGEDGGGVKATAVELVPARRARPCAPPRRDISVASSHAVPSCCRRRREEEEMRSAGRGRRGREWPGHGRDRALLQKKPSNMIYHNEVHHSDLTPSIHDPTAARGGECCNLAAPRGGPICTGIRADFDI